MKSIFVMALAILGSGTTSGVLATPRLLSVLTSNYTSGYNNHSQAAGSTGASTIQLATADRRADLVHAGYIVNSFVDDAFDYANAPTMERNVSARYNIGAITVEPDQFVHGQISMHQQIHIGGVSGERDDPDCQDNTAVFLGTQMILTYSGRTIRRPYYHWSGDGGLQYLDQSFGPVDRHDEIYSHIRLKGTTEAEVLYENISKGTRFVKTITGKPICIDQTGGSWTVGFDRSAGFPTELDDVDPFPGFDARIFWDAQMYSDSVSKTRLPYFEPLDLVRSNGGKGQDGVDQDREEVQFATSYDPFPGEDYFGVYWNLIPSWTATDAKDLGKHN